MPNRITLLAAAALLAAGCSSAPVVSQPPSTRPAAALSSPTPALPSASAQPVAASPDVTACRAMEAYPKFTTAAQAHRYIAFLGRQVSRAGTSTRLDNAAERVRADLSAVLLGAGSEATTVRDANRLQAVCTSYGVRG